MKITIAILAGIVLLAQPALSEDRVGPPTSGNPPTGAGTATNPTAKPQPNDAAVNTSRSNIKHPNDATAPSSSTTAQPANPAANFKTVPWVRDDKK